ILAHEKLQGLRRFMLVTADAQSLYAQFGFKPIENPERYMAIKKNYPEENALI
ncbi:MAG: N-acetyltransferase, partial [Mucilaginibacter polytrichastri]|nr:N-acetyltransferase [Mucilaginibacter polytrichastri]